MKRLSTLSALRIISLYLLFGGLWVGVSDRVLELLISDVHKLTTLQTYKGWLFVAASGLLLYLLARREFRQRERTEEALRASKERAERYLEELTRAYDTTIEGWAKALELRDKETEGHTKRATEMTLRIARAMGLTEEQLLHVRRGALLHDIGKMSIPDSVLLKNGPLTEDEWGIMRRHPVYAFVLLSPIAYLRPAIDIPYCHHERWDGAGYPRGLKGEQIPLAARIFALADTWDALYSERRYHAAWSEEQVRDHIRSLAGTQFDPQVVEAFLSLEPARSEETGETVRTAT